METQHTVTGSVLLEGHELPG